MRIKTKENFNLELIQLRKINFDLNRKLEMIEDYIENHTQYVFKSDSSPVLKADKYFRVSVILDIIRTGTITHHAVDFVKKED